MRPSGALCCFTAFAAAAFEFLAEQEAVVLGNNKRYLPPRLCLRLALCRRRCAEAFFRQFDPTARSRPAPGSGRALSLITACDPLEGFI